MGSGAGQQSAGRRRTVRNPLRDPRRGDVVVLLHAHPDDESIFTGGTIAQLAEAGAVTVLVTATMGELGRPNGELGRPNDPFARAGFGDDVPLAAVRREELRLAGAAIGVTHHLFLGGEGRFTDSGYDVDAWTSDSLARNAEAAERELLALLCVVLPQVLVTFDRDGCTGHPDHLACHAIGVRAAAALGAHADCLGGVALIADPLRARGQPHGATVGVDTIAVRKRKARAIGCHFSQVGRAVQDPSRLASLASESAVARYLPHVISNRPAARHERYAWVPARRLRLTADTARPATG
jgi:LmbE family N-acetylglucosaminyl deacetylase